MVVVGCLLVLDKRRGRAARLQEHIFLRLLVISRVTMNIYESGIDYFAELRLNNHEYVSMHLHLMGWFSVFKEPGRESEQGRQGM